MRRWGKLSFKTQILLLAAVIVAVLSGVFISVRITLDKSARKAVSTYLSDHVQRIEYQLKQYYVNMTNIATVVAYDPDVQKVLMAETPQQRFEYLNEFTTRMAPISQLSDDIFDISIMNNENERLYFLTNALPSDAEQELLLTLSDDVTFSDLIQYTMTTSSIVNSRVVVSCKAVSVLKGSGFSDMIGRVHVMLEPHLMSKTLGLNKDAQGISTYIIDSKGKIVCSSESGVIGEPIEGIFPFDSSEEMVEYHHIENEQYITYSKASKETGYMVIGIGPYDEIAGHFNQSDYIAYIIFAGMILIIAVMVLIVFKSVIHPVEKATQYISVISSQKDVDSSTPMNLYGSFEMQILADEFNAMMDRLGKLNSQLLKTNEQLYESKLLEKQLETNMLISQINPHFLYNTLESIKGMAMYHGQENISSMTGSMAEIFRYTIRGPQFVLLRQEMEVLKQYLTIQTLRFKNRFSLEFKVHEDTLDLIVPKMILQPICENSIQHGIELMESGGKLTVEAETANDKLYLKVTDNGAGIPEKRLNEIRMKLKQPVAQNISSAQNHIGMANVHGRIQLYYGQEYGIEVESRESEGTAVCIILPVNRRCDGV